jgi:LuxR family quorum sensing-dependent transcriptional regulator
LIDAVAVPMTLGDDVAGVVTFSGNPELTPTQMRAIHVLSYSLFARVRAITTAKTQLATVSPYLKPLTPREKEVMRLSAAGRTSAEIARELGLSPRTVNQHVENVAEKLGTKNRTHTITELMRHHMLA